MYHLKGISNLLSFLGIDGNEIKHNHSKHRKSDILIDRFNAFINQSKQT
jgi:hypothetical protein